jgi:uncharacterized membrane protein
MTPTAVSHEFPSNLSSGAEPAPAPVGIRRIDLKDIRDAVAAGFQDVRHFRTDALSIAIIYPIAAAFLATVVVLQNFLPLVFPVCAGFALLGPMATLWFAALSRQRERGDESVLSVFTPARLVAIQRLAVTGIMLFVVWNVTAGIIYGLTLGSSNEDAGAPFFHRVLDTDAGWTLITVGCATGAVFAVLSLTVFFISFPLVLDRPVTASQAIGISVKAMLRNPFTVLAWGAVVVVGLVAGAIPVLLGIVIALPTLGHASWHLYRRVVV